MSGQREAYTLPTQTGGLNQFASGFAAGDASGGPTVQYVCGECAAKVSLGRGDAIRCSMCGHRVLYKERTKRMVQFEAR
ncbi:DNA-directed RNA polymerase I, II, and III subunit RPABC4 [Capronia epimyces CBS 606.96]|uniref:DNA-directed RNA polymerase I, II, and III subunit RPABC4 n=1 Tax=Capronia epimyces CBS 606.96 TaxID=1182542 RepID=W9Y6K3_9EURO|nr:DNA-directed RNA polymerase I, II, and III subunit RPABC4 [Capronia epimyces CBS 606.96]EXJ85265.1 DNA-directed RNA polymerase I, II, and III subunit RPABC4 [Capronia epimyces CBS 606.96]